MSGSLENHDHGPDEVGAPARADGPAPARDLPEGVFDAHGVFDPRRVVLVVDDRRPVVDSGRLELMRECALKFDDGLAPLVAAGVVHPELARITMVNLRTAARESNGSDGALAMSLPRTILAITAMERERRGGA
jgi:hypothetical protein